MPNILDALKKQEGVVASAPQAGAGATSRLKQVMNQLSGRATAPAQPQQNLLEEAGIADVKALEAQPAAQAQQLATQQVQQTAQNRQAEQAITQQRQGTESRGIRDQAANRAAGVLQELAAGNAELDLAKNKSKAEQLSFDLRLGNEQYIQQLQQEGAKQRLGDKNSFEEATMQAVFGEEYDLMKDKINWDQALLADELAWQEEMNNLDMEAFMTIAELEAKQAGATQTAQGIAQGVEGGAKVYSSSTTKKEAE